MSQDEPLDSSDPRYLPMLNTHGSDATKDLVRRNSSLRGFLDPSSMEPLTAEETVFADILAHQNFGTSCDTSTTALSRRRTVYEKLAAHPLAETYRNSHWPDWPLPPLSSVAAVQTTAPLTTGSTSQQPANTQTLHFTKSPLNNTTIVHWTNCPQNSSSILPRFAFHIGDSVSDGSENFHTHPTQGLTQQPQAGFTPSRRRCLIEHGAAITSPDGTLSQGQSMDGNSFSLVNYPLNAATTAQSNDLGLPSDHLDPSLFDDLSQQVLNVLTDADIEWSGPPHRLNSPEPAHRFPMNAEKSGNATNEPESS